MEHLHPSYFHFDIHYARHCTHFESKKTPDATDLKVRVFLHGLERRKRQVVEAGKTLREAPATFDRTQRPPGQETLLCGCALVHWLG
jgi:hypothetical protein